ncbi:short-chain dehydrogenase, partial [Kitasatospora sp. NPDC059722]
WAPGRRRRGPRGGGMSPATRAGPAPAPPRPTIDAATAEGPAGRTGVVIGAGGRPVTAFRAATDPRVAAAVRRLSELHAPLESP